MSDLLTAIAATTPTPTTPPGEVPVRNYPLEQRLIQAGLEPGGVGRRVRVRRHRCGALILTALDGDVMASTVTLDPVPVDAVGEALAILAGRDTWRLRIIGGRTEVDPRDSWDINANPAGTLDRADVLPGHICGAPWPPALTIPTRLPLPAVADGGCSGEPPF